MKCRHAKSVELNMVCNLLAEEFYNDPVHKTVFSSYNEHERIDVLRNFFRIFIDVASNQGGTLITENGIGALVYFRPDVMEMSKGYISVIDNKMREVCGSDYTTAIAYTQGLEFYRPRDYPHYYILFLAVQRRYRGINVTGSLFNALHEMADKDNSPCYAECTRYSTRTLLRRWGYRDMSSPIYISGVPELFPVWRVPHILQSRSH
ncbi:hypothetical protein [Enterobacter bugandensis]|uniref:hypothetical protein n=1 Tax=Enterobacter bugandensis TaxID=881260 RepID=UPI0010A3FEEA|nr:hypothetical protein [Enterobacter bugandensis]THE46746.1 hypothetical protein EAI35_23115 [Enterobacter bugandensis]